MDGILEKATKQSFTADILSAKSIEDIATIITDLFSVQPEVKPEKKSDLTFPQPGSDYDNRVRGVKTRERINELARQILESVDDPEDLTEDQRQVLAQYSGKGGLTDNSQDQYYTPPEIARGVWDALKANGFANGNVCEPSCGNGVFLGTKPEGVKVSANDLDPVSSKIARLLNPSDDVKTGSLEEIAVATPDNHFDAIIGNIPFGKARGRSKGKDPAYQDENRVDRYFILRTLDKLKPGGLCCLIVPTVIVGKKAEKWAIFRSDVSKKAEFLGAHKLPSGAFSKGETGTDTVVDVIVLQKHPESLLDKIDSYKVDDLKAASVLWDQFISGRYWEGEGKKYIHGTYIPAMEGVRGARERVDGDIDNVAIKTKLAAKFQSRIDWDMLQTAQPIVRNYADGDRRVINGQQHELQGEKWVPVAEVANERAVDLSKFGVDSVEAIESIMQTDEGMLSVNYGQASAISTSYTGKLSPEMKAALDFANMQQKDEYREQAYRGAIIGIRITKIMNGENIDEDYLEKTRQLVAAEYEKYGHPEKNKGMTVAGQRATSFGLFLNAMDKDGNFSELLKTGHIEKKESVYDTSNIGSIVNYLTIRLEKSPIELQDIIDLYSGDKPIKSIGDLAEIDEIAISPDGMIYPYEQFCSGNIYPKIADLTSAMNGETDPRIKDKWQDQIDRMLSKATFTNPDNISFTFQQKWFKPEYIVEFLKETGEYPDAQYREGYDEPFKLTKYGASGWVKSLEDYLNGSKMTARGGDKDEIERKRQEYAKELQSLTERFSVWMRQHEDIEDITNEYNRKFNGFVPFEHSGAPLGIEEYVSGEIDNHTYQCSEIRRISELGSGINGFQTGLGKSYTALGLVAYNLKKQRAKRTCIVVPDAVLENWLHESKSFYSKDFFLKRIKFVGIEIKKAKDGSLETIPLNDAYGKQRLGKNGQPMSQYVVKVRKSPEDIFKDMWEVPQSNFALVVMSKEKFRDIPVKPDTRNAYVYEMVEMHLMGDKAAEKAREGGKKKKSYDEAVSELNLEGKYAQARFEKGELPFFEDMGFDNVIFDECHFFKNSVEPGKVANNTAFIPTAGVAAIAREISVKSHWIRKQNCGRGVVGLSATPVTNSPFEIFNQILQVADIEYFRQMGINGPDDFIRIFGKIEQVQKQKMDGSIRTMDGLKGFQNLDGLRGLFNRFVNVKKAEDVGQEVHVPEPVERRGPVSMNDEQEEIYQRLREEGKEAMKNAKKDPGKIFSIMRDMERVSTDPDMYHKQMTFTFPAKYADAIQALVNDLPKKMAVKMEDDEKEGQTETIEIPLKYSLVTEGDVVILTVPDDYEGHVMDKLNKFKVDEADVCHPLTPKYAELIANCKKHLEQNGKQIIFTEEKTQHQKIVRILLLHLPISRENIGIINATEANGAKLDQISKAFNGGQIKIVVANKKAEVGVNLQRGTTAIHHLTLPWTPASINQRNGRGVRQGNHVDYVDVYYYLAQSKPNEDGSRPGCADDMRLNTLQAKARWIDELFASKESTFLNPDADDDAGAFTDIFASDPEEAARLRKQRKEEELQKAAEATRQKMRIELARYASNWKEYNNIDVTKENKRAELESKIQADTFVLKSAEEALKNDDSDDNKKRVNRIKYNLASAKASLTNLDSNFEKRKEKLQKMLKQSKGMMEQAERSGNLPFDNELISNPECVVHINGVVFQKGKYVEIQSDTYNSNRKAVCRVVSVDTVNKSAVLEYVVGSRPNYIFGIDGKTPITVNSIKNVTAVSYTEDDIALLKITSENIEYKELPNKLTKEQFERVRSQVNLMSSGAKAYRNAETGKMELRIYTNDTEGLVYPEKTEAFAREVVQVWLDSQSSNDRENAEEILGVELFGKAWSEFAPKGSDSDISAELGRLWEENWYVKRYADDISQFSSYNLNTVVNDITREIIRKWPNTEDIKRVSDVFFSGIKTQIETKAAERKAEQDRIAEERRKQEEAARIEREKIAEEEKQRKLADLKADPNFKELPHDIVGRLNKIGITIKLNTTDVSFRGMNGAGSKFQRIFLSDSRGKSGALFKKKDDYLKPVLKATFTSDWNEASGAWWHLPYGIVENTGGLEKLASIMERAAA